MASPFRSESQAFRFVLLVAAGTVAVVVANRVAGTAVQVVVDVLAACAVAAVYLVGRPRAQRLRTAPPHVGPPAERRAVVLVDDLPDAASLAALRKRADRVLVVAPAGTSTLRHWTSDLDDARAAARSRMEEAVSRVQAAQLLVSGVVGDEDPLAAVDDALRTFGGDELVVATSDPELVGALHLRYAIPVTVATDADPRVHS